MGRPRNVNEGLGREKELGVVFSFCYAGETLSKQRKKY